MLFVSISRRRRRGNRPVAAPSGFWSFDNAPEAGPLELTNAEKLALTGIEVGQQVSVSDGFYVSGAPLTEGFYTERPGLFDDQKIYIMVGFADDAYDDQEASIISNNDSSNHWIIYGTDADVWYRSDDASANPWGIVTWTDGLGDPVAQPALTHPAIQQYTGTDPSDEANWEAVP